MFYLYGMVLGAILGLLFGGKLSNALNFKIDKSLFIIASFILQVSGRILGLKGYGFALRYGVAILIISYVLLFIGIWFNRRYMGLWLVGTGAALNALVTMANNGKMPVSRAAAIKANVPGMLALIEKGMDIKHSIIDAGTVLPILADIIYVPKWLVGYGAEVASIGDLVVLVGISLLVFTIVKRSKSQAL